MKLVALLFKASDFLLPVLGTAENGTCVLQEESLPLADLVGVDSEFGGEFRKRPVLAEGGQDDLCLECVVKDPAGSLGRFVDAVTPLASSPAAQI